MMKFVTWYFPVKVILALLFLTTNTYAGQIFFWFVLLDLFIIPIAVTIINLFKRKKIRAGEYKVKPEGRRL